MIISAKNQTENDLYLYNLSIPDTIIPASDEVNLTDNNLIRVIQEDTELLTLINAGSIVLIVDGVEYDQSESVNIITSPVTIKEPVILNSVFGTEYTKVNYADSKSTISGSPVAILTLTTASLPEGTYRITWAYEWRCSKTDRDVQIRVQVDNDEDAILCDAGMEAKDKENWRENSGFDTVALTAAVHTVDLDLSVEGGPTSSTKKKKKATKGFATAYIRNMKLEIWRIS